MSPRASCTSWSFMRTTSRCGSSSRGIDMTIRDSVGTARHRVGRFTREGREDGAVVGGGKGSGRRAHDERAFPPAPDREVLRVIAYRVVTVQTVVRWRTTLLGSPVDGVLEVRVLHALAVADLQQVPLDGPCRERAYAAAGIAQAPPPLVPGPRVIEPDGDGGGVLSIRAQVHVGERVISQPEYSVVVQEVLRAGRKTANDVIEWATVDTGEG